MWKKRILYISSIMMLLLLTSCFYGRINHCGEYGECIRDIEEAQEYPETIEDIQSIELISCVQGLTSTNHDGIPSLGLVEDESGICFILVLDRNNEYNIYSYGNNENTKLLNLEIKHTVSEIHDYFLKQGIDIESTRITMDADSSDEIYLSVNNMYFTFSQDDLKICEYMIEEYCQSLSV